MQIWICFFSQSNFKSESEQINQRKITIGCFLTSAHLHCGGHLASDPCPFWWPIFGTPRGRDLWPRPPADLSPAARWRTLHHQCESSLPETTQRSIRQTPSNIKLVGSALNSSGITEPFGFSVRNRPRFMNESRTKKIFPFCLKPSAWMWPRNAINIHSVIQTVKDCVLDRTKGLKSMIGVRRGQKMLKLFRREKLNSRVFGQIELNICTEPLN